MSIQDNSPNNKHRFRRQPDLGGSVKHENHNQDGQDWGTKGKRNIEAELIKKIKMSRKFKEDKPPKDLSYIESELT